MKLNQLLNPEPTFSSSTSTPPVPATAPPPSITDTQQSPLAARTTTSTSAPPRISVRSLLNPEHPQPSSARAASQQQSAESSTSSKGKRPLQGQDALSGAPAAKLPRPKPAQLDMTFLPNMPDSSTAPGSTTGNRGTQATQAELESIAATVPGPFRSKVKHYEALLDSNATRSRDTRWSDRAMIHASGIAQNSAWEIRYRKTEDGPQTAEAREYLDSTRPTGVHDPAVTRYARALDENDRRIQSNLAPWANKSMRKAAGINSGNAVTVEYNRTPPNEHVLEMQQVVANLPADAGPSARYEAILQANAQRETPWARRDMLKAAGIAKGTASRLERGTSSGT